MPRVKIGRPPSGEWQPTAIAAAKLGLSPDSLLALKGDVFLAGTHYRCKNPRAIGNGRRYIWHLKRCDERLAEVSQ